MRRDEDIEREKKRVIDEIKNGIANGIPDGIVRRAEIISSKRDAKRTIVEIMIGFDMTPSDAADIVRDFVERVSPPRFIGTGMGAVVFQMEGPGFSVASITVDDKAYNKAEFVEYVDSLPSNVGEDDAEVINSENGSTDNVMEDNVMGGI
jgi:hypothetical protein